MSNQMGVRLVHNLTHPGQLIIDLTDGPQLALSSGNIWVAHEVKSMDHSCMPMVADSPFGVLDATLADDALVVPWDRVYRVRPRASLVCRACQKALHAKVSKCGLRFFAHDAVNKTCPLTGETLQHRLLKSALAGAVRRCGWHAELEARASDGKWIGDVLASSPDGSQQVVWEAQLARQHDDDTLDRTAKYLADGIEVVWVFDRFTAPKAPHVTVEVQDRATSVIRPLASLRADHCGDTGKCGHYSTLLRPPPCPGHGTWESAKSSLDQFVAEVCQSQLRWLPIPALDLPAHGRPSLPPAYAWICDDDAILAGAIRQSQKDADVIAAETAKCERALRAAQRQREQEELAQRREQQRQQQEKQAGLDQEQRRKEQELLLQRQRAQDELTRLAEQQRQQQEQQKYASRKINTHRDAQDTRGHHRAFPVRSRHLPPLRWDMVGYHDSRPMGRPRSEVHQQIW